MDTPKPLEKGLIVEDTPLTVTYLTNCVTDFLCDATEAIDSTDKTVEAIAEEVRAKLAKKMLVIFDGDYESQTKTVIDILNIIGAELEAMEVRVCVNTGNGNLVETLKTNYPTVAAYLKPAPFTAMQSDLAVSVPFKMPAEL